MIEQIITSTKVIQTEHLSAEMLDRLIFYCAGENARTCVIRDNNKLPVLDAMLEKYGTIRQTDILDKVFPNPKVSDIMEMSEELKGKDISVIVGIGGGSTLDSAKGVVTVLSNGGDLDDYLGPEATRKIEKREIKLVLIPTTAGTGSEVTKVAVYTSHSGRKYTLNHPLLQADIAVLVTEYVYGLPPAITASTAFDALSHALETLWNGNATLLSDRVATESAVQILRWMETAWESSLKGGKDGRAELLEGACMAGTAFNMTGTAAVHAISFILSEEWQVPHGIACAFTLEDVFRLNMKDKNTKQKLVKLAKNLFGEGIDDELLSLLLDRIMALKKKMSLPCRFQDLDIALKEDHIGKLSYKALDDPKMRNNSVSVDCETLFAIIKTKI